jgi:DNA-binding MarR family transcriptional regulator
VTKTAVNHPLAPCHTPPEPPAALPLRSVLSSLTGDVDPTGLQVLRLISRVSSLYDSVIEHAQSSGGLSGPRWHLLMRLWAQERRTGEGLSPSGLSRCLQVSRNTVSVLLRGLEEQGLIERTLDAVDKRGFCIRLTKASRTLIREHAPAHLAYMNRLLTGLTSEEQAQLIELLGTLYRSIAAQGHWGQEHVPYAAESERDPSLHSE